MKRWLYRCRAVSGDPQVLAQRLRDEVRDLLVLVLDSTALAGVAERTADGVVEGWQLLCPRPRRARRRRARARRWAVADVMTRDPRVLNEADLVEKQAWPRFGLGGAVRQSWRRRKAVSVAAAVRRR